MACGQLSQLSVKQISPEQGGEGGRPYLGPGGVPPPSHVTVSRALLPRARLGLAVAEAVVDLLRLPLQPVVLGAVDLQGAVPQPALRRALAPPRDVPPEPGKAAVSPRATKTREGIRKAFLNGKF